jgi:hypothetical protein
MVWNSVCFTGEILVKFQPEMHDFINIYAKDFLWEKKPKFARFWRNKFQILRFLSWVPVGTQEIEGFYFFSIST